MENMVINVLNTPALFNTLLYRLKIKTHLMHHAPKGGVLIRILKADTKVRL